MRNRNAAQIHDEVEEILASVDAMEEVTDNYDFAIGETNADIIDFATRQRYSADY